MADEPPRKRRRLEKENNKDKQVKNDNKSMSNKKVDSAGLSTDDFLDEIKRLLSNTNNLGSFAFGGVANDLSPICSLTIDNVGDITFPLTQKKATKMMNKLKDFTINPDDETRDITKNKTKNKNKNRKNKNKNSDFVLQSRNSLEIKSKNFKFTNSKWSQNIRKLTKQISNQFDHSLKSKIAKLVMYYSSNDNNDEINYDGDDDDNKSEESLFGKLIIQLPSDFEMMKSNQAPLIVDYNSNHLKYYFGSGDKSEDCKSNVYYTCYLCDDQLKVSTIPINSGYRIVVVYNLFLSDAASTTKRRQMI